MNRSQEANKVKSFNIVFLIIFAIIQLITIIVSSSSIYGFWTGSQIIGEIIQIALIILFICAISSKEESVQKGCSLAAGIILLILSIIAIIVFSYYEDIFSTLKKGRGYNSGLERSYASAYTNAAYNAMKTIMWMVHVFLVTYIALLIASIFYLVAINKIDSYSSANDYEKEYAYPNQQNNRYQNNKPNYNNIPEDFGTNKQKVAAVEEKDKNETRTTRHRKRDSEW